MVAKRCGNIFEYNYQAQYYRLIALLYDKVFDNGLIAEADFYCPLLDNVPKYDYMLKNITDRQDYLKTIENLIAEKNLNIEFCKKLRDSISLRYLLAIGFHDVPLIKTDVTEIECKLFLDCSDANHRPNNGKNIVELCFENPIMDKKLSGKGKPYEYFYDRQEIYSLDNGKILVIIGMNNRGEIFKSFELSIVTSNIIVR